MLNKIIFFFAWLGIFVMSLTGIVYVTTPKYFVQFDTYIGTFGYDLIIIAISIIYFVICIVKFLSLFKRTKDYAIKTEHGIVYVSAATVATYIRELLVNDKDVSNLKIDTFKKGKKFNISVKLDMLTDGSISDKSTFIQNEIKTKLADMLGIEVGEVQVKISKLSLKEKKSEEETTI